MKTAKGFGSNGRDYPILPSVAYVVSDHLYDTDGREQSALGVGSWAWKSGSMAIVDFVSPSMGIATNDSRLDLRLCPKPLEVEQEMNHDQWIESAEALLHLDEKKALVPHGIGGHSRTLLEEAITLLRAHNNDSAEPVAWRWRNYPGGWQYVGHHGMAPDRAEPLYLASPPAKEVERLRLALQNLLDANEAVQLVLCDGHEVPGFDPTALGRAQLKVVDAERAAQIALTNRTPDDEVGNG